MKPILKSICLAASLLLCLSALMACKPNASTTTTNPSNLQNPSPYADLTPAQVLEAVSDAKNYQITAYYKTNSTNELTMTRKILQKNDQLYRIHTETYDGEQAIRTTVFTDTDALRTYQKNNGLWEYFSLEPSAFSASATVHNTLKVSTLFPYESLFTDENYDVTDSETSTRSMSEAVLSSFLKAKKSSLTFAHDRNTNTYTIDGVATTTGEKGITVKNTLKIEICFAENTVTLPDAEDGEAYPAKIPENIYEQILRADQLKLYFDDDGPPYTLSRADNRLYIRVLHGSAGVYSYYYDFSNGTYYVKDENQWYAQQDDEPITLEEMLPMFRMAEYYYLFDASNYAAPAKGAENVSFSQAALTRYKLKSAYYIYDKKTGEHQFTCIPQSNSIPHIFKVSFDPQTVTLPDVEPDPLFHMTPDELGVAIGQPGQYRIVKPYNYYNNLYEIIRDGNMVKVIDNVKKQTLYYDLDAHTVYSQKNGKWVCSADSSSDRWKAILRMVKLDTKEFYEAERYQPLQFQPDLQQYTMEQLPTTLRSFYMWYTGRLYDLHATYEDGSTFGDVHQIYIEFADVGVTLPS